MPLTVLADRAAPLPNNDADLSAEITARLDRILARVGDEGTLATPGMHLLRIVQTDALELSARLRSDEVQDSRSAGLLAFDLQGERYPVELRRTVPVIDPRTRIVVAGRERLGDGAPVRPAE